MAINFSENYLIKKFFFPGYQLLLCILFSIIFSGQFLGVLRIYKDVYAIILSLGLSAFIFWIWRRKSNFIPFTKENISEKKKKISNRAIINSTAYLFALLLAVLIFIPNINWPNNTMEDRLDWDAGEYHFPKAIELYKTGSVWDFSFSYGEYPFGFESLLSFNLLLTDNLDLFSFTHSIIVLLFIISIWLLGMKYTNVPGGIIFLLSTILILSGFLPVFNPWYFLRFVVFTVGKNDLFLAAALLSAMVFSPLGKKSDNQYDLIGLGVTSAIAISIKPNSALILLFIWLFTFISHRKSQKRILLTIRSSAFGIFLAFTGGIWIVRNLFGLGKLFDENTYRISSWSIASNATNPTFFLNIPNELKFSIFVLIIVFVLVIFKYSNLQWRDFLLIFVSFLSFIITPATSSLSNPTLIAWRFGIVLLIVQFILLIVILEPMVLPFLNWILNRKLLTFASVLIIAIPSILLIGWQFDLLRFVPEKSSILERPYSVNNAQFLSVFDFIDENIHNSIIWVEGAQSFFAYDPDFSNSISREKPSDYIIFVDIKEQDIWIDKDKWQKIYEDERGMIFQRLVYE
ncbi:MAG: hypothetical protein CVU40_14835 [Chloroflexi bacterium HGW-Chloroflexi-2]|jgi:hypothetical protein|nr:MAG: hypothetical protein CVU40_14835 [Chloroflexi bacterium HGW-Chloroflexi-2]